MRRTLPVLLLAMLFAMPAHARRRASARPSCPALSNQNVVVSYYGAASGCTYVAPSYPCGINEQVAFRIVTFGDNMACGAHTIVWDFGDGTVSRQTGTPSEAVVHSYASAGVYSLAAHVSNGSDEIVLHSVVYIASASFEEEACRSRAMTPGSSAGSN